MFLSLFIALRSPREVVLLVKVLGDMWDNASNEVFLFSGDQESRYELSSLLHEVPQTRLEETMRACFRFERNGDVSEVFEVGSLIYDIISRQKIVKVDLNRFDKNLKDLIFEAIGEISKEIARRHLAGLLTPPVKD